MSINRMQDGKRGNFCVKISEEKESTVSKEKICKLNVSEKISQKDITDCTAFVKKNLDSLQQKQPEENFSRLDKIRSYSLYAIDLSCIKTLCCYFNVDELTLIVCKVNEYIVEPGEKFRKIYKKYINRIYFTSFSMKENIKFPLTLENLKQIDEEFNKEHQNFLNIKKAEDKKIIEDCLQKISLFWKKIEKYLDIDKIKKEAETLTKEIEKDEKNLEIEQKRIEEELEQCKKEKEKRRNKICKVECEQKTLELTLQEVNKQIKDEEEFIDAMIGPLNRKISKIIENMKNIDEEIEQYEKLLSQKKIKKNTIKQLEEKGFVEEKFIEEPRSKESLINRAKIWWKSQRIWWESQRKGAKDYVKKINALHEKCSKLQRDKEFEEKKKELEEKDPSIIKKRKELELKTKEKKSKEEELKKIIQKKNHLEQSLTKVKEKMNIYKKEKENFIIKQEELKEKKKEWQNKDDKIKKTPLSWVKKRLEKSQNILKEFQIFPENLEKLFSNIKKQCDKLKNLTEKDQIKNEFLLLEKYVLEFQNMMQHLIGI
ncbi:MAG: hypothetical protein AMS24_00370 [Chlamydiae bacterium SM23_39]|nr:MAG: hypothetical protein AMS24_00370 [Chlamydiae bacterium SM23_39]